MKGIEMRIFEIEFEGHAIIELDDEVIDAVDDEWRSALYPLYTPEEIAEHIGYNFVINNAELTYLDGWAHLKDSQAKMISKEISDIRAVELQRNDSPSTRLQI